HGRDPIWVQPNTSVVRARLLVANGRLPSDHRVVNHPIPPCSRWTTRQRNTRRQNLLLQCRQQLVEIRQHVRLPAERRAEGILERREGSSRNSSPHLYRKTPAAPGAGDARSTGTLRWPATISCVSP